MVVPTLTLKRVRRGVHHVTYTDGGVQGQSLRFVVRDDGKVSKPAEVEAVRGILESMPEEPGVHAVYEGPLDDSPAIFTASARLHPKTVSGVIMVATMLVDRCQRHAPERAEVLIRQFNAAAHQVFRDNFLPIQELTETLEGEAAAS